MIETKTLETAGAPQREQPENPRAPSQDATSAAKTPRLFLLAAFILLGLFVAQLGIHLTRTSVTYDEKVFILAGYRYWRCANYTLNPAHPPLAKLVAAWPLRSKSLIDPAGCNATVPDVYTGYVQAAQFLPANGIDPVVIPARWAAISFSLLLAVALLFGIRRMFGWREALVALALLAFEPVLIAHGSLATTDMAIASTFFLSVIAFYFFCEKPTVLRALALGLAVGSALASKHPALPAMSLLCLLLGFQTWLLRDGEGAWTPEVRRRALRIALGLAFAFVLGWVCLWATYRFHYYAVSGAQHEALPFQAQQPPSSGFAVHLVPLVNWMQSVHLFPESYLFGLGDILHENTSNPMFLFGKQYPEGAWYYFPIALAIKTSLPLLIFLLAGLAQPSLYRKYPRAMGFLLIPGLGYLAFGMASNLDIGIRHILPVYPFLIGVAAAGACEFMRRFPKAWALVPALLVFGAVDSARTLPNDIAFSNELWGGTNNTYKFLSDSNVDWGQNLKQVAIYVASHHIQECWIVANGTPEIAQATLPCRLLPAPFQVMDRPMPDLPATIEGTVFLSNEALPAEFPGAYETIAAAKPDDVLGGATLVYHGRFDVAGAAARVHASNSQFYYAHNNLPDAVADLQQVIALQPGAAAPHFVMGMYLRAEGQPGAARDEFKQCLALSEGDGNGAALRQLAEQQLRDTR